MNRLQRLPFLIIVCLLMFAPFESKSQKIIVLDRAGHIKRVRFYTDDFIRIKVDGIPGWVSGEIEAIGDSAIAISDANIQLSRINTIRYASKSSGANLLAQIGFLFPIAGGGFLSIASVNALINGNRPILTKGVIITSSALILTGPLAYMMTYHKSKINKRNQLKVLDLTIY